MKTVNPFFALLAGVALALSVGAAGCGDDNGNDDGPTVVRDLSGGLDFTVVDMAIPGADLSGDLAVPPDLGFDPVRNCYPAPEDVHEQIINACTGAQCIKKTPKASYLDGGCCPPLP